jgi:hypothetical protein
MEFQLKPISTAGIPEALQKIERYRLLNEPSEAQSICEDILRIDPNNQEVLVMLLLSITDQFEEGAASVREARQIIPRLESPYQRAYYAGIVSERSAKAVLRSGVPGANFAAYEELEEAMRRFDEAEALRPEGNDDAILRWNTCARILMKNPSLRPRPEDRYHEVLGE